MRVIRDAYLAQMQLQNEIISSCRKSLENGKQRRSQVSSLEQWMCFKEEKIKVIKEKFPSVLFNRDKFLNSRVVSKYEFEHFRIENVLFESLPGWEVNATVYLPGKEGIYPGVVCPTGHSNKGMKNYQRSAQVFARNGYIAVSFDPPGCSGEKGYLNDHFVNGITGYLTGFWSQTYFVADAIAAVDYLYSREDVDYENGVAVTGVSGGGLTSLFTALLDDRIGYCAPVCCLARHEDIHLRDLYTSCPEQFGKDYIAEGLDYSDYISLLAPLPCLIVAGKKDEVFDYNSTFEIYKESLRIYNIAGRAEDIGLFLDEDSGHAYTLAMANEVVKGMNRYIGKRDTLPEKIVEDDLTYAGFDELRCYPSDRVNMFTVNRDESMRLAGERRKRFRMSEYSMDSIRENAVKILGLEGKICKKNVRAIQYEPELRWFHHLQKVELIVEEEVHLPGLLLKRAAVSGKRPILVFADEKGKWESLRQYGFLTKAAGFNNEAGHENEPIIFSVDISGLGELEPLPVAYDLAGWNNIERILTYLSIANGEPVMGKRVRDLLAILEYVKKREDVDSSRIMLGGRGIGAVAALHAALIWGEARKVICLDMLSHYGALAEEFPYIWRESVIIPDILKYYDLPDIAGILAGDIAVAVINPQNAAGERVDIKRAMEIYGNETEKGLKVICNPEKDKYEEAFVFECN